jgi:DDE_Tnp_1-associated
MGWKKENYEHWKPFLRRWKTREWNEPARHRWCDILILAICGVICGAEGWVEIEEFGKAKEAWFTELLNLPNGIPSHDTFGRVFAHLDPKQFEASFFQWVQGISQTVQGVIAIDGRDASSISRSCSREKSLAHGQCMGSRKPVGVGSVSQRREKSNEITAIPVLLRQ